MTPLPPRARTLRDTIESHDNNYTLVRLVLSASVIYHHSFALSPGYSDPIDRALAPLTSVGGLAVLLFFFLSGLFVAQSFHKDTYIPSFVFKRFFRIWPGLFVCLALTATLMAAMSELPLRNYLTFDGFYRYILGNSVFDLRWEIEGVMGKNPLPTLNGSIHTLPMEAKMYVVLAAIGALDLIRTRRRIAIAGAVAILMALTPGLVELLPTTLFNADYSRSAAVMFLAGVMVYGLSSRIRLALWQGVLLISAALLTRGGLHALFFYTSAVWIVLMVGQSAALGALWRPRHDLSYGIYIYGWPSQQLVMAASPVVLSPYGLSAGAVALATVFAAFSWRCVEKPAIAMGKDVSSLGWAQALKRHRTLTVFLVSLLAVCLGARWASNAWDMAPLQAMPTQLIDFGPRESRAGVPFNQQPNGRSALWIKIEGAPPPEGSVVVMDGKRLSTQISPGMVTAEVPKSVLWSTGDKSIYIERRRVSGIERTEAVQMRIKP
ncbi:acyltransferase [Curvibacter sp. RS43]|uniref:acyltransferase family protein n=1 Tax=Curvibacter microcysteis TaxID=3026419 RepID=UPI0023630C69|nr:acyltransferase [Curvibacter sp. RS43]MDD0809545.1 acyltransferase [Curvibacter sp. RS43]